MSQGLCCSGVLNTEKTYLPLLSVDVKGKMNDLCGEVTITQTFKNELDFVVDADYEFPLDPNSAISGFVVEVNGVRSVGKVLEKVEARETYEKAIAAQKTAMLMVQREENSFVCNIGQLAVGALCTVMISYVSELEMSGTAARMVIPRCIAPKYKMMKVTEEEVENQEPSGVVVPLVEQEAETEASNKVSGDDLQCAVCNITPVIGKFYKCDRDNFRDLVVCGGCVVGVDHVGHGHIASSSTAVEPVRHAGFNCDGCGQSPLLGVRYECTRCFNYDLCHTCEQGHIHDPTHPLKRVTRSFLYRGADNPANFSIGRRHKTIFTLEIDVFMPSRIEWVSVTGYEHEGDVDQANEQKEKLEIVMVSSNRRVVKHNYNMGYLPRDFAIMVRQESCYLPRLTLELNESTHTAALALAFTPPSDHRLIPGRTGTDSEDTLLCNEFIFLLDCSGSMRGASIKAVEDCMSILLKSLPLNSRFNIVRFGSTYEVLYEDSAVYDDESLCTAMKCIKDLQANLHGTEIYPPLQRVLSMPLTKPPPLASSSSTTTTLCPRQIFLLTDGQVEQVDALVALVHKYNNNSRLFVFGMGSQVDRSLCHRLAHAGSGAAEFVFSGADEDDDEKEETDEKPAAEVLSSVVMKQLTRSLSATLMDVKVDWGDLSSSSDFRACPERAPAIFGGTKYVLYALNVHLPEGMWDLVSSVEDEKKIDPPKTSSSSRMITISALSNRTDDRHGAQKLISVPWNVDHQPPIVHGNTIHLLAARARIRDLEARRWHHGSALAAPEATSEILKCALQYGLMSRLTSFVVVPDTGTSAAGPACMPCETRSVYDAQSGGSSRSVMFHRAPACASLRHASIDAAPMNIDFLSTRGRGPFTDVRRGGEQLQSFGVHSNNNKRPYYQFNFHLPQPTLSVNKIEEDESTESVSKKRSSSPKKDPLLRLIDLANVRGLWICTDELMEIVHSLLPSTATTVNRQTLVSLLSQVSPMQDVGATLAESADSITALGEVGEIIVSTHLVLLLFSECFDSRKAEWSLLKTKSLKSVSVLSNYPIGEQLDKLIIAPLKALLFV